MGLNEYGLRNYLKNNMEKQKQMCIQADPTEHSTCPSIASHKSHNFHQNTHVRAFFYL